MKKGLILLVIAAMTVCSCNFFSKKTDAESAQPAVVYKTVSEVLEMAAQNVDSLVSVKATLQTICDETGKVCEIVDEQGNTLRIESTDSLVVFTPEMMGKAVIINGTIKEVKVTAEEVAAMAAAQEATPEADRDAAQVAKIAKMQEWMTANEKDTYVSYFVLASQVELAPVEAVVTEEAAVESTDETASTEATEATEGTEVAEPEA